MKKILSLPAPALYLAIGLLSACMYLPFLGSVHLFDWDEINFSESAREMLLTGDYFRVQVNFQPFWEKPPFFIWMQVASMKLFGVTEFAARFPNAMMGVITSWVLFYIGKREFDVKFGLLWVAVYMGSFLPHFYFRTAIMDPTFNLFIFLGIYLLFKLSGIRQEERYRFSWKSIWSGFFIGMAIITKGPVALLVFLLCLFVFLVGKKRWNYFTWFDALSFLLVCFLTSTIWFGYETYQNGLWFIQEFIIYQIRLFSTQDAGHGGPFVYHFIVLLIGCFPASVFFMGSFGTHHNLPYRQRLFIHWMMILFWVHLILFSIVKTKIVHYSSLCYFPLTFLGTVFIYKMVNEKSTFKSWQLWIYQILAVLIAIIFVALPWVGKFSKQIVPYIQDPFVVANLQAQVTWPFYLFLMGPIYLILICWLGSRFKTKPQMIVLSFVSTALIIQCVLASFVPRIERYSQGALIDFYKSHKEEDVYVQSVGFKSYGQYFYTRRQAAYNTQVDEARALALPALDKPVYLVVKNMQEQDYSELKRFKRLGEKNGYVFFVRERGH
jgi:4-amino-4-deoxy-L-arabinose transferase-like glycosyltransferase